MNFFFIQWPCESLKFLGCSYYFKIDWKKESKHLQSNAQNAWLHVHFEIYWDCTEDLPSVPVRPSCPCPFSIWSPERERSIRQRAADAENSSKSVANFSASLIPSVFCLLMGHEVFNLRAPDVPTTCIYTIRPYQPEDEVMSYYFAF